jgi:hypothetical protein
MRFTLQGTFESVVLATDPLGLSGADRSRALEFRRFQDAHEWLSRFCSLDQPAVAARAGYGRTATGFRPDWALLTRNGDVYAHSAGDGAPLARTRHPSKATFEIAVVGYVTYLLRPAKGGLELLPL